MRIRTKLFALVGALSFVTVITSAVGISTVRTYDAAVHDVKAASIRALYSERLNRLVTAVVMDARGVYAAKDTGAAKQFSQGILARLTDIDTLLEQWQPLVPEADKPLFDAVRSTSESFKAFRTETARLGVEVSPQSANEQGNNEANRANRKAFQESIDALTQHGSEAVEAVDRSTQSLYDNSFVRKVEESGLIRELYRD